MMGFGLLLFLGLLIVPIVVLMRGAPHSDQGGMTNRAPSARQILEERYARGEINQEQFLTMLKDIM